MIKILVVGSGAREHAICEHLLLNRSDVELFVFAASNNPGISKLAKEMQVGDLLDFAAVANFAQEHNCAYGIIGPENPICAGLVDYLAEKIGLQVLAPKKLAAQLEGSKAFTRSLMEKYSIPGLPGFRIFNQNNKDEAQDFILDELKGEYVVKYDGLVGGKGVKLSGEHLPDLASGLAYIDECLAQSSEVVIEEKLVGQEFSLIAISDGTNLYHFPLVQDHKRAHDGDTGPNTGGMGTYTAPDLRLPFVSLDELDAAKTINKQIIEAVKAETGVPYVGVLYGGFMVTKNGVKVIEYNSRFGDPEAMNLLNHLEISFVDLLIAALEGRLAELKQEFKNQATVCLYLVPNGYPDQPEKGGILTLIKEQVPAKIYFASVDFVSETENELTLKMLGSRAVAVVGFGDSIEEARQNAAQTLGIFKGPFFFRTDIGSPDVIYQKVQQMQSLKAA